MPESMNSAQNHLCQFCENRGTMITGAPLRLLRVTPEQGW
jgi:hypothetical protein